MVDKLFLQKCSLFIGASLCTCSLPFVLIIEPEWCSEVGYILAMTGFTLIVITGIHRVIFGDIK